MPEVLQPSLPAVSGLFTNLMHLLVPGGANKLEHEDFLLECFIVFMLKSEMRTLEDSEPYFFTCYKKNLPHYLVFLGDGSTGCDCWSLP